MAENENSAEFREQKWHVNNGDLLGSRQSPYDIFRFYFERETVPLT